MMDHIKPQTTEATPEQKNPQSSVEAEMEKKNLIDTITALVLKELKKLRGEK